MAMFVNTCPASGDTAAVLWKKINDVLSESHGGAHPPKQGDWKYNAIWKVLAILAECN